MQYTRSLGGYFSRFSGGVLARWVDQPRIERIREPPPLSSLTSEADQTASAPLEHYEALDEGGDAHATHTRRIPPPASLHRAHLTMEERATLACLMVRIACSSQMDREVHENEAYKGAGSTASVLLLHSLDLPAVPWYASEYLSLTTIQLGDTRFLLCSADDGRAVPLTSLHHPDDRGEAERLSRLGAGIVTDSFGERRFLGTLANTRAFGDAAAKRYGVTSEPEVRSLVLRGAQFAFAIGVSDGITAVMSDQEIVDECRYAQRPQEAAQRVLRYAEDLGTDDNATVLVVPLRRWGQMGGTDRTQAKREARRNNTDLYRTRRQ